MVTPALQAGEDCGRHAAGIQVRRDVAVVAQSSYPLRLARAPPYEQVGAPLQQRALAITEAAHGPGHPGTARAPNNLAITYRDLGQDDKAQPLEQRALEITEATPGPGYSRHQY